MKISFVIPTLNFAEFIPATLDSIVDEGRPDVEIIVFDGGSTDNTLEVLGEYKAKKFPELRVVSAVRRGSIDIDLNLAVAEATGHYVWTLSADDALISGWAQEIDRELAYEPELVLVPAIHCDLHMLPRRFYPILRDGSRGVCRLKLENTDDVLDYLAAVRTSEGLFSFCSACIVRRDSLNRAPLLEDANGTCWRYSARLISVLADLPSAISILDAPLLLKRGDNDSFGHAGPIRRLGIATENWDRAIHTLDIHPTLANAMASRAKSDIKPTSLLYLSQFTSGAEERELFRQCVRSRMDDGSLSGRIAAFAISNFPKVPVLRRVLLIARPMYRDYQARKWRSRLHDLRSSPPTAAQI